MKRSMYLGLMLLASLIVSATGFSQSRIFEVKLWNEADCSGLLGTFVIYNGEIEDLTQQIREKLNGVSSFGDADGITINGQDFSIDFEGSYNIDQLTDVVLAKVASDRIFEVKLWNEADCTGLLGTIIVYNDELVALRQQIVDKLNAISSAGDADALTVNGIDYNIDREGSYDVEELADVILGRVAGDRIFEVKLWNEADCTGLLGVFVVYNGPTEAIRSAIYDKLTQISSAGDADGLTISGRDYNIDLDGSYDLEQLADVILAKVASDRIFEVKLWNEADCTELLGTFVVYDAEISDLRNQIRQKLGGISSAGDADGITVNGQDYNIDLDGSYDLEELTDTVLARLPGNRLYEVQLWNEADCSGNLGKFVIFDAPVRELRDAIYQKLQGLSSAGDADGLTVNGQDYNIDREGSYDLDELADVILFKVAG